LQHLLWDKRDRVPPPALIDDVLAKLEGEVCISC
jgi:hypothetical protein